MQNTISNYIAGGLPNSDLLPYNSMTYCEKLKKRYLKFQQPTHCVTQYVRLALVLEQEDITAGDGCLDKITKLTLQGEIDIIRKKKEALDGLGDIFHYESQPCPQLILIVGGPGKCSYRVFYKIDSAKQ